MRLLWGLMTEDSIKVLAGYLKYSWSLNNAEELARGANPLHSQKSVYNFWLPPNLTTKSRLLSRSLANNVHHWRDSNFVCYVFYILYSYNKEGERKENVTEKIMKFVCKCFPIASTLQNFFQYIYWKKKKSVDKWVCTVQTYIIWGSPALFCVWLLRPTSGLWDSPHCCVYQQFISSAWEALAQ